MTTKPSTDRYFALRALITEAKNNWEDACAELHLDCLDSAVDDLLNFENIANRVRYIAAISDLDPHDYTDAADALYLVVDESNDALQEIADATEDQPTAERITAVLEIMENEILPNLEQAFVDFEQTWDDTLALAQNPG